MTVYYTPSEEAYVKMAVQARELMKDFSPPRQEPVEVIVDIPDMGEAERIWKLLCISAESSK